MSEQTLTDLIVTALRNLGGRAQLPAIYNEVRRLGYDRGGKDPDKIIRSEIQKHSRSSRRFTQNSEDDLFRHVGPARSGTWELREVRATNITRFFADTLKAKLKNTVWSWGALDRVTNRVYLRVWRDDIETFKDGERVLVAWDRWRYSNGFVERHAHLAQMQDGAEAFGVVCRAVDPDRKEPRRIADFDGGTLLQFGGLIKEHDRTYARIAARIPLEEVTSRPTAQSALAQDLEAIERREIESTTKKALVNARLGQGAFRSQVLQLWENCCSVTRSVTLDAIRASHIKPWRESNDEERLDPNNGLPLVASLDSLFDAGLISFESSGTLIASSKLSIPERQIFGVSESSLTRKPTAKTAEYLAFHRKHVFRK